MKRTTQGAKAKSNLDVFYDFYDDYDVINVDFKHYHGRSLTEVLQDKTVKWPEFCAMMSNLGPTSGLAYLVSIRGEKDIKKIKKFSPHERKIYLDWKKKHGKQNEHKDSVRNIKMEMWINALKEQCKYEFIDNR